MKEQYELSKETKDLLFTALNDMMISVWDGRAFTLQDYSELDNKARSDIYFQFLNALSELGLTMRDDVYARH